MRKTMRNSTVVLFLVLTTFLTSCGDPPYPPRLSQPIISIDSPAEGSILNNRTVAVSGTASPSSSGILRVEVNGVVAEGTNNWSVTLDLDEGSDTITAEVVDNTKLTATASIDVCVDSQGPAVSITSPSGGAIFNISTITVTGTVSDVSECGPISVVTVNGLTASGTTDWTITLTGLGQGTNNIIATATDAAGNSGSDSVAVCIDSTAPVVTITQPPDGSTLNSTTVTVDANISDANGCGIATVAVLVNGATQATSLPADVTLGEGSNTIEVVVTDVMGNTGSDSVAVCVDSSNPTISINSPTDGAYLGANPVSVTGSVDGTGVCGPVSVVVDPGAVDAVVNQVTGSWSATVFLAEGANTITATATDASGNSESDSINVTVDIVPPIITIIDPIDGTTFNTFFISVTITTDAEVGNTASIKVNGITVKSISVVGVTNTFTGVQLAKGPNTLIAAVYGSGGSLGTSPPVNVTVSTAAPGIEIAYPPTDALFGLDDDSNILAAGFQLDRVTVSTDAVDGSTVVLFVNGQTATKNSGDPLPVVTVLAGQAEFNDVDLLEGANIIVARVTDKLSLLSCATLPVQVRVQTGVLTIIITSPADGATVGSQILVKGKAYPADDVSLIIVNGETANYNKIWRSWNIPLTITGCGPILIQATVWDKEGGSTNDLVNVFLDTPLPVIDIVSPTDGSTINANEVVVSGTADDGCTGIARVMVNGITADYDLGNWTATIPLACLSINSITATAIDEAGNQQSASVGSIFSNNCLIPDSISIAAGTAILGCSEATVTLLSGTTGVSGQGHNIGISTDRFYGPVTIFAVTFEQPSSTVPLVIEGFTVTDGVVQVTDSPPPHLTGYGLQCLTFPGNQNLSTDGEITSRVIDTTGYVRLRLNFLLGTANTEGQDAMYVLVTNDYGVNWYPLFSWVSPGDLSPDVNIDVDFIPMSVRLPSAYFADGAQIQIKFVWWGSQNQDDAFLDNVVLIGEPGRTIGAPVNYLWDFEPPDTISQPTNVIQDFSITVTPVNVVGTADAPVPPGVRDTQAIELGPSGPATPYIGGQITSDPLDLTETSEMYLTFDIGYNGVDAPSHKNAGDSIVVSASTNGSTWSEITTFFVTSATLGQEVNLSYETKIFYLPQIYAISDARIRFNWRPDKVSNPGVDGPELAYLDNALIWNVEVDMDTGKPKDRGFFISDNRDGTYTFDICSDEPGQATICATWDDGVNPPLNYCIIINF